jgi:hypothetical protein
LSIVLGLGRMYLNALYPMKILLGEYLGYLQQILYYINSAVYSAVYSELC